MSRMQIDPDWIHRPEIRALSDAAFRLHIYALCDSLEWETDGHVSRSVVQRFSATRGVRVAMQLVEAGLWDAVGRDFQIRADECTRAARRSIGRNVRARIIDRDGLICRLCGHEVTADDVHIDHIRPVLLGGGNRDENLRVSHSQCNLRRPKRPEGFDA